LSDTRASVVAGLSPLSDFLNLAPLFRDEMDRNVWSALLGGFGYLNRAIEPHQRPALRTSVRELVRPAFERLGWEAAPGESELISQLRWMLVGALGTRGHDGEIER